MYIILNTDLQNLERRHQNEKKPAAPDPDALPESFYDEHHPFSVKVGEFF